MPSAFFEIGVTICSLAHRCYMSLGHESLMSSFSCVIEATSEIFDVELVVDVGIDESLSVVCCILILRILIQLLQIHIHFFQLLEVVLIQWVKYFAFG